MLALLREEARERLFKTYVTDTLRILTENVAKLGGGSYMPVRWIDLEMPKPQDERSGDEIAADVIKRIGLSFSEET